MRSIAASIPAAAVPFVSRALIEAPEEAVPEGALIPRARRLAGEELDYKAALNTLILRGLVSAGRDGYSPVPSSEQLLAYYANSAYSYSGCKVE